MRRRCSLCGGKLNGNICTECGLDNSKNDRMIKETEKLIHFIESSNTFSAFDDSFLEYLDCIIVYSRTFVGFKLKCGLTLKEEICTGTK